VSVVSLVARVLDRLFPALGRHHRKFAVARPLRLTCSCGAHACGDDVPPADAKLLSQVWYEKHTIDEGHRARAEYPDLSLPFGSSVVVVLVVVPEGAAVPEVVVVPVKRDGVPK
jgi:hypothetical protein